MKTAEKPRAERKSAMDDVPPQNLDAERGVLSSMLLLQAVCDDVALVVQADDFYLDAHQTIYRRAMAMHNEGGKLDALLLHEALKVSGELDRIGGLPYLIEVVDFAPHAGNAVYYAKIVQQKAMLRRMAYAATEILREVKDEPEDAAAALNRAEEHLFRIRDERAGDKVHEIGDVLIDTLSDLDSDAPRLRTGIKSGFGHLDSMMGGFRPGTVTIIAGRPGHGKSAIAANIAEHIALREQKWVLFVSLEMSRFELSERMLCSHASINSFHLRCGSISRDDRRRLMESYGVMAKARMKLDEGPNRSMVEIAAMARRLKRINQLDLLLIDYIGLIVPENRKEPRQEQVAGISRRLKTLAKEFDVPVICLAQLNRQADKDPEPQLYHLRESGAIEQDADNVLFVWRTGDDGSDGFLKIAKQRNGPVGKIKLVYQREYTRFRELADARVEEAREQYEQYGLEPEF